jgi:hypothetical protein
MYDTRTEWFDGKTQVPAHEGIYERKYLAGIYLNYWDGKFWGIAAADTKYAVAWRHERSTAQDIPFRGLKVKP